jgi:cell division protease FtsH
VDAETKRIVEEAVEQAWELLDSHREALDGLAKRLFEQETVNGEEVAAILAQPSPEIERSLA